MSSNDDEKKQFPPASQQGSNEERIADTKPEVPTHVDEIQHGGMHEQIKNVHHTTHHHSVSHSQHASHHTKTEDVVANVAKKTDEVTSIENKENSVHNNVHVAHEANHHKSHADHKHHESKHDETKLSDALSTGDKPKKIKKDKKEKQKSKRKRSGIIRNPLIILANFALTLIVIAVIVCVVHFYTDRAAFEEAGPSQEAKTVLIRPGAGVGEIATILERENIITRAQAFKNGVSYYDQTNRLKAGEYEFPAHASMHQAMDIITSGKSIEYSLTIPEGLTVQQAIYRIRDNDVLSGDLPEKLPLEGSLLADTVRFTRGTTRKEIIRRLEDGQKKLVQAIWEKRSPDIPVKNINEFVTLASIVEKETGIPSERPMVAGVFTNRLKQDMRLDSDPTFLYGIYGGEGKPANKPVTRDDRLSDTPYNTYRMKGLPPTPIAIPGRDALEAVANPAKTDALFFVADGTGGHIFANTLEEHNNNVAKWRQFRASQ